MAKLLIDTNVLIDALRGTAAAETYFKSIGAEELSCSSITVAELWAGVRSHEEASMEEFLQNFGTVTIDYEVARHAGGYMRHYAKSHQLNLPDALIAASAQVHRLALITRNVKHFPMKDIRVLAPY